MKELMDVPEIRNGQAIFDSMNEEVHVWKLLRDPKGTIKTWQLIYANASALKVWGYIDLKEIKGKTTDEIFGHGATEHYLPVVKKIMSEGKPHSFQDYFPNIDKHFRFTSTPMNEYFFTTGWDISEFVQAHKSQEKEAGSLKEEIGVYVELEKRVQVRTEQLEQANRKMAENIDELQKSLEQKNEDNTTKLVQISTLLLKQSDILQSNSRILESLNAVQKENKQLRKLLTENRLNRPAN